MGNRAGAVCAFLRTLLTGEKLAPADRSLRETGHVGRPGTGRGGQVPPPAMRKRYFSALAKMFTLSITFPATPSMSF